MPILTYIVEVDEGFGSGFTTLSEQASTYYSHLNLILGHSYTYRVKASNALGYGAYSTTQSFTPRTIPGQPTSAPRNLPLLTTRTDAYIEYDAVTDDGGSAITSYVIWIDDGTTITSHSNGLLLTYDTSLLTLTSGLTYKFSY